MLFFPNHLKNYQFNSQRDIVLLQLTFKMKYYCYESTFLWAFIQSEYIENNIVAN